VAFAANVFTLFVFYEAITLSTFPLVTHSGTEQAKRAGRVYLGILMGTSIAFLLLAMVWTWLAAGTTDFRPGGILAGRVEGPELAILLALYAFGTGKAALMPFHRWLPAAMVAPTPVSALLHAVAVVKAGVFTILKVVVYVFGIDLLAATDASRWLTWVAAFTIIAASTVALTKDNLKARLAYSTVSQLSYIVLGAALATSAGVLGGGVHIVMHAFGKITLFFCAGAIWSAPTRPRSASSTASAGACPSPSAPSCSARSASSGCRPWAVPGASGSSCWARPRPASWLMMAVLMASSLLSIAYLMPVVVRGFFRPAPADGHHGNPGGGIHEAPLLCVLPPVADRHRRHRALLLGRRGLAPADRDGAMSDHRPIPPVRWLDDRRNVKKVIRTLFAVCALVGAARPVALQAPRLHFDFEYWPGFYSIFGFVACVFLVLAATQLRKVLMRDEDYYD
jgi:multicomponent Na+:H+ antiporter subunit D